MKLVKETANLFRITRFGLVNCYLVREADGLTLVDAGLPGSAAFLLHSARELKLPLRRILLTHAHFDHIGAVDALLASEPGLELLAGNRESRLLARDFHLDEGEHGKILFGFPGIHSRPARLLLPGDRIGSLKTISSPGHTPGHLSFLDTRDNALLAGDAFTTQTGVVAAGTFSLKFPFPALFSWNAGLATESAIGLRAENPTLLATGHGKPLASPLPAMDAAIEEALRQHPAGG